ncbi:DUF262 domain-containing protein [Bacteroides acidifaciens]|uniref:DUF262 domain-containing protein n=1 Tax=Bacteroides acidifaciens TaxID=85831 RepID=UPI002558352B|nr:DUF262 domain-containing protein [Bacteroides acidifaciens]
MNNSEKTFRSLFIEEGYKYVYIPRIQRDYAQGRKDEVATNIRVGILDDVAGCKPLSWGIVFGVSEEKDMLDGVSRKCFIPIDGQQRLTTLFLLHLYGLKRHGIPFEHIKGFNYETRSASKDFIEALINNWVSCEWRTSLKKNILNQGWFLDYWSLDPTVDAILNMLTAIDKRFHDKPEVFENLDRITFEFLDLRNLDLNETLYLKMNSRGRKLSQFDLIKSEIDKILPDGISLVNDGRFDLYDDEHLNTVSSFSDKWRYCMDRKWSNLFWNRDTHSFDAQFIAFFSNFLVAKAGAKYEYVSKLLDLNYNQEFYLPWKYFKGYLEMNASNFFNELSSILNKLVYNSERASLPDGILDIPANFQKRAEIFGLLCFKGEDYSSQQFQEWNRFIRNYAYNTVSDKDTFFAFVKRIDGEFANHSLDILSYLANQYDKLRYERTQLEEECYKASLLINGGELAKAIRVAENHPMLEGRLRPLLVDHKKYVGETFIAIWHNFERWFGKDGNGLAYKDNDSDSLNTRVAFAEAFTKSITQMNQLFSDVHCLDFSSNQLKDKLRRERFEPIFRRILISEAITDLSELPWSNSYDTEGIQTKKKLLQDGVIRGILRHSGGERLRFRWYYNCSCFYPVNGRINNWRIGFDRISDDPVWSRNRNEALSYLEKRGYNVAAERVSDNEDVHLWWGGDIQFSNIQHPELKFSWNADYNVGIIDASGYWVKRKVMKEGVSDKFLFQAVGKSIDEIERCLDALIAEYYTENK